MARRRAAAAGAAPAPASAPGRDAAPAGKSWAEAVSWPNLDMPFIYSSSQIGCGRTSASLAPAHFSQNFRYSQKLNEGWKVRSSGRGVRKRSGTTCATAREGQEQGRTDHPKSERVENRAGSGPAPPAGRPSCCARETSSLGLAIGAFEKVPMVIL